MEDKSQFEALVEELRNVFEFNGKTAPEFLPETPLDESFGLDSLDWAEFAVRFQKRTGRDLFTETREPLRTFADLAKLVG